MGGDALRSLFKEYATPPKHRRANPSKANGE
jgi:hypothetical protein